MSAIRTNLDVLRDALEAIEAGEYLDYDDRSGNQVCRSCGTLPGVPRVDGEEVHNEGCKWVRAKIELKAMIAVEEVEWAKFEKAKAEAASRIQCSCSFSGRSRCERPVEDGYLTFCGRCRTALCTRYHGDDPLPPDANVRIDSSKEPK